MERYPWGCAHCPVRIVPALVQTFKDEHKEDTEYQLAVRHIELLLAIPGRI